MPNSSSERASKNLTMSWLPSSVKKWGRWLKSRELQAASRLWEYLSFTSLLLFMLIAFLYILLLFPPYRELLSVPALFQRVVEALTILALVFAIIPFVALFALVLTLSFHPKTRKWVDQQFHFRDLTEFKELEVRVSKAEAKLVSVDERLNGVEQRLGAAENRLDSIDGRLGNIETSPATLAGEKDKTGTE